MKVTGGCQCGAIRYSAEIDASAAAVCHCTDCQKFSGAPFRASAPARRETFRLERGEPARYIKTAESGNRREQVFCGTCGSALYATSADGELPYMLRLGAIDQRADIVPEVQIWHGSAQPWALNISTMPARDGN